MSYQVFLSEPSEDINQFSFQLLDTCCRLSGTDGLEYRHFQGTLNDMDIILWVSLHGKHVERGSGATS